jgi:hypothetical protein
MRLGLVRASTINNNYFDPARPKQL